MPHNCTCSDQKKRPGKAGPLFNAAPTQRSGGLIVNQALRRRVVAPTPARARPTKASEAGSGILGALPVALIDADHDAVAPGAQVLAVVVDSLHEP